MQWPGKVRAGAVDDRMLMTIDLFPTIAGLIGAKLPEHKIDGLDVWPILRGDAEAKNPHDFYAFYYEQNQLQSVVSGDGQWKLQLPHTYRSLNGRPGGKGGIPAKYEPIKLTKAELYHVTGDIAESKDVITENADIEAKLNAGAEAFRADLGDALTNREGSGVRKPGMDTEKLP